MIRNFIVVVVCFFVMPLSMQAQRSYEDSMKAVIKQKDDSVKLLKKQSSDAAKLLKTQKDSVKLFQSIDKQKSDLAKLELQLTQQIITAQTDKEAAQKAADENKQHAANLSDDSQDKKKAKRAGKSASDAQKSATKARKSSDKVGSLEKDIKSLKSKIDKNEAKLAKMRSAFTTEMP